MGDGAFTLNNMGTLSDNIMDFNLMDELLFDGFWLETTEESSFWQPGPSTSSALDFPSNYSLTPEINIGHFSSNLDQASISEETKTSDFVDNKSSLVRTQMDEFGARHTENLEAALQSASSRQPENFLVEGSKMNTRLWVGPNRDPTPNNSVRKRLVQAIDYLKKSARDKHVLIQIWVPVKRGGRHVLMTKNQPFFLDPNCKSLAEYRHVSRNYQFAAEEDSKELVGLPGRVFLKKLPEWTPDVRFFKREEYPRVNHAQQYNVRGSLALPVFQQGSGTCLGVVEIVSTAQKVNYRPELENVCKALEAVDLRSISISPKVKDCDESYQVALADILSVLKCVCDMNKLPLAQTWAPCSQQGKGGCRHSDDNYLHCVSTVDSACYVRDPQVMDFHVACSEHHLLKGEGVPGGAFTTNQPCFATDITAFSKTEYPLSHHAKVFGLRAAVAIRLRSIYTGSAEFVLEFFLPIDCKDAEDQKQMLNTLSSAIEKICHTLQVVTDQEFREETTFSDDGKPSSSISKSEKQESSSGFVSSTKESSMCASSWIAPMADESRKGKNIAFSLDSHSEKPEEEFKLTTWWDNDKMELHDMPAFPELTRIQHGSGLKGTAVGSEDVSAIKDHQSTSNRSIGERKRTKNEKSISLQVLRQYFSGTLKDAAKSIGVCPTTLKRICRQHGITRWPSRKIKKVGHSLRKLQLVIDSVQGAEGAIQLNSFYNNFPELNSTDLASPSNLSLSKGSDRLQQLTTQPEGSILSPGTTASKSTSSGSHSSSSSFCCSAGAMQSLSVHVPGAQDASSAEQCNLTLKRACSDAELHDLVKEETKLLVRSRSQKIFRDDVSPDTLPPLPHRSSQISQCGSSFRVKASFGEEKIRFRLQPHWGFEDLLQEVKRRFNIDNLIKIDLKYLDDDLEWVLLTCDDDLEECIDIYRSSNSCMIRLSLHQPYHLKLGSSFGSHGSS
ncbi:hypothetical protein ACH5RR_021838 [Cinchona calisaya]|uniref:Uncharacterized protein n=1 Tax=Cinchona calisaya TaxID=153742 RepID=A0ABD2Z621_9GENT